MAHVYQFLAEHPVNAEQLADELRDVPGFRELQIRAHGKIEVELDSSAHNAIVADIIAGHLPDPAYTPMASTAAVDEFLANPNPSQHDVIRALRALCMTERGLPITGCPRRIGRDDLGHLDRHAEVPYGGPIRRNLLFHLWPVRGMWEWHFDQLRQRQHLFNGKRILALAIDEKTDDAATVQRAGAGLFSECVVVRNDPKLREVLSFRPLFERVRNQEPDEITCYAHGKGMRHETLNDQQAVTLWTQSMYEVCLDYPGLIEKALLTHSLAGPFVFLGRHPNTRSTWQFSGTFFWLRHCRVFARSHWAEIDPMWMGMETWPGLVCPREEAACLFYEQGRHAYSPSLWNEQILPALAKWKAANAWARWKGESCKTNSAAS